MLPFNSTLVWRGLIWPIRVHASSLAPVIIPQTGGHSLTIFRRIRQIAAVGGMVYLATIVFVAAFAILQPFFESDHPTGTVIIVLGGGMSPNGTLHRSTTVRVARGVALFLSGAAPRIHFTGGAAHANGPTAGEQMAAFAQELGLPETAITIETQSHSTLQNALFSRPDWQTASQIILVTEGFHLPRSWASFKLLGADHITLIHARRFRGRNLLSGASMVAREALAIWFNGARYLLWQSAGLVSISKTDRDAFLR
jgi:uncharacterized SAM-binding protein YcdF (DUF218 family)